MSRPRLLLHCQHSLGLGHLVRSLALADALAGEFAVTLLNGGRVPAGIAVPTSIEVVHLPALGHDERHQLVSHESGASVEEVMECRRRIVLDVHDELVPDVVVVELYPFGRRRYEFELVPLLHAAAARPRPPLVVVCSVRDILVQRAVGQARHDERAARRLDASFDLVLVHSDPTFARLEETFRPDTPTTVPIHHTGFVAPERGPTGDGPIEHRVLVSVGGGMVGEPLLRTAADSAATLLTRTGLTTTLVTGPFLPAAVLADLRAIAGRSPAVEVIEHVDDLCGEMARSAVTVSQCGYNTTLDVMRAWRPAVVVPYAGAGEDEQRRRAARLAELGVVTVVDPDDLDPAAFVDAVAGVVGTTPPLAPLDLGGGATSARFVREALARRAIDVGSRL